MDILDDMGVSKLSANVFLKVNYSFKSERAAEIVNVILTYSVPLFHYITIT